MSILAPHPWHRPVLSWSKKRNKNLKPIETCSCFWSHHHNQPNNPSNDSILQHHNQLEASFCCNRFAPTLPGGQSQVLQESVSARGRSLVCKEHSSPPFFASVIFSLGKKNQTLTQKSSAGIKYMLLIHRTGGSAARAAINGIAHQTVKQKLFRHQPGSIFTSTSTSC